MIRIVLPTGIFPPDIGGPASYVPRIASALVERGHAVEVVTLADEPKAGGAFPFPVRRIRRGMSRIPRMIQTVAAIRRLALSADLIYANGLFIEAAIAAALSRKPLAMKIVGDWAWERARNEGAGDPVLEDFQSRRQPFRWEAVKALRAAVTRRAIRVIAPSRYLAKIVAGWGVPPSRIDVVYNALEPLPRGLAPDLPAFDGHTLLSVARLVKWKGIDTLLELVRERTDLRLLVAGDGPERGRLESLAGEMGIRNRVQFLGNLSRERVTGCMQVADVFCLPSVYEGLPHVILEAFAASLPVIATAVGGTVEAVDSGSNGLLVPPGNRAEFSSALDRLFSESGLRSRLVENARRTLQTRFQWEPLVDRTERILAEAAAGRRSA
jgi:glycosyltransferase involved in cell wall biosynthesis